MHRTLKTPQILELSGIGNPNILRKIGIQSKVDLPGVGTNAQDHVITTVSFGMRLRALVTPINANIRSQNSEMMWSI